MENNLPPPPPKATQPPVLPPGAGGPLPPNVTPGWNDPPNLSTCSPSSGPKRLLNKRVPFPLGAQSTPPATGPLTSIPNTPNSNMDISNQTFNEISKSFSDGVSQLPNNTTILKDMERFVMNWKDIASNQEVIDLLMKAAQNVKNQDVAQCEVVHKQLLMYPAAGWFTLFLHNIINCLRSQNTNL